MERDGKQGISYTKGRLQRHHRGPCCGAHVPPKTVLLPAVGQPLQALPSGPSQDAPALSGWFLRARPHVQMREQAGTRGVGTHAHTAHRVFPPRTALSSPQAPRQAGQLPLRPAPSLRTEPPDAVSSESLQTWPRSDVEGLGWTIHRHGDERRL